MVKDYGYFKDLLKNIKNNEPLNIYRINLFGSRMSSKTFSSVDFMILACLINKVYVYAFRYMNDDKKKLMDQIIEILNSYPGLKEVCDIHLTNKTITFPNGSVIEVFGLHKQKNDEVKLTGLSGKIGFKYGIAFAEERYEISDKEWSAVLQAIRGFDKFLEIHAANPWIFTNDYVAYCNDVLTFDLDVLEQKGQQFKIYKGEIYHYSNYQINHYITEADKRKLLQAAKHDPHRKDTILFGFPGIPEGSVWKYVLPLLFRDKDWDDPNTFVGCVDYGEKGDATAAYVIGFSPGFNHSHVSNEYYWSNKKGTKEYKKTDILADEVIDNFINFVEEKGVDDLPVYVDSAAIPFITALNNLAEIYNYDDIIHFYQSKKYRVEERTEQIRTMASFGMLTVGEDCPELRREYQEQVYSKKSTEYVDGDDHGTDSVAYGLANKWVELLDNLEISKYNEIELERSQNGKRK